MNRELQRQHPAGALAAGGRGGFTLVEILMAISLSMLILGAAAFFIFSSFNLFTSAQNDPGLEHHKLGVQAFVQNLFDLSMPDTAIPLGSNTTSGGLTGGNTATGGTGAPALVGLGSGTTQSRSGAILATTPASINTTTGAGSTGLAGNTTAGNTTAGGNTTGGEATEDPTAAAVSLAKTNLVGWGWPPGPMGVIGDPYLTFVIPSDNPFIVWEQGPRPPVRGFLSFREGVGLELMWVPPPTPGDYEQAPIRRTKISSLVTKLSYIYYDPRSQQWTTTDTPPKDPIALNTYVMPDFLQLTFNLEGKESKLTIRVPPSQSAVPMY